MVVIGLVALVGIILSGCQTFSYYRQAIAGQYEIVSKRRPIKELLAETNTPPALRERLQLVLNVRQFAEKELKLPIDGHYSAYADLHRPFVVWNVYAAPEFSMESKTWWYPFVGKLEYRGYFSEKAARKYATHLAGEGYDVYVGGVEAYSTLGWFKDPVLNTFVFNRKTDLVETLFHELAHQRVFAKGDTDFNEAFATSVGREGLRRWLDIQKDTNAWEQYQLEVKHDNQFVELILQARRKLETIYADFKERESKAPVKELPALKAQVRQNKSAIVEAMRSDYKELKSKWGGYSGYDRWFTGPLNNAQLDTVSTYHALVPVFQKMLRAQDGDLEKFYQQAQKLARLSKKERKRRLQELAN